MIGITEMASKLVVAKDNRLIQASYALSISEQRVILLCIAKLDSRERIPEDYSFTVSVDDLMRETGVSRENAKRDLANAVNNLYKRTIKLDSNEPDTELRWLFQKAFLNSGSEVTLYFSPPLLPFISELRERFTTYRLKDVTSFKCQYSIRLYELIMQRKDKNEFKVDVVWFRDILQLGDKYPRVIDLKKYVIFPAIADINASNLQITFNQVKKGKEITHFVFKYVIGGKNDTKKITDQYIQENARPGESWEQARSRLSGKPAK